jgi:hypothetical protein
MSAHDHRDPYGLATGVSGRSRFLGVGRGHQIAMSDYDTTDWPGRTGLTAGDGEAEGWGKAAFRGACDLGGGHPDPTVSGECGPDLRGKLPWIGLVEAPDWDRSPHRYGSPARAVATWTTRSIPTIRASRRS